MQISSRNYASLFVLGCLASLVCLSTCVIINEESDLPIKRLNAGMAMTVGVPLEAALEKARSAPFQRNALLKKLGATPLTQRAGRNLILRVLLAIGEQNGLTDCTAQVLCEQACNDEVNKVASNYYDTYSTDDEYVSFVIGAAEKGRELGGSYNCGQCYSFFSTCSNANLKSQVLQKYQFLMQITNYVLAKMPS